MGGTHLAFVTSSDLIVLIRNSDTETQVDAVDSEQQKQNAERGAKTAEKVRYGQTISEGGMGGKTTEAGGNANQGML